MGTARSSASCSRCSSSASSQHRLCYFLSDGLRHFLEDIQSSLYETGLDYMILSTKQ